MAEAAIPTARTTTRTRSSAPVDPVLFPPVSLGAGGDRKRPGRGRFAEMTAYVNGTALGYFSVPMPNGLPGGTDPLRVLQEGKPYDPMPVPPAYVFDGSADSAFPADDQYPCTPAPELRLFAPAGRRRLQQAGADLLPPAARRLTPKAWPPPRGTCPVVAEAGMGSTGLGCQQLKSTKRIKEVMGMMPPTTGKFLAWLMIDPAAPVYPRDIPSGPSVTFLPTDVHPGVGLQRWGWFNRYLVAYLDGGYIPTEEVTVPGPTIDMPTMIRVRRMTAAASVHPAPDPHGGDGDGRRPSGRRLRRARVQAGRGRVFAPVPGLGVRRYDHATSGGG